MLTSVHPNLSWDFKPVNSEVFIKPGEVTTIEYIVENFGNKKTTGIATFAYFPSQLGNYISKINSKTRRKRKFCVFSNLSQ